MVQTELWSRYFDVREIFIVGLAHSVRHNWFHQSREVCPYSFLLRREDGSKDAGDDYRVEGREKKEKETDLFYGRLESLLSAITASFTAFFTPLFSNPTLNPP